MITLSLDAVEALERLGYEMPVPRVSSRLWAPATAYREEPTPELQPVVCVPLYRFAVLDKRRARRIASLARRKSKRCKDVPGIALLALDPCAYCNGPATTHDHIEPYSRGGAHDLSNLVRCCWRCNKAKGTRALLLFLATRHASSRQHTQ